MTPWTVAMVLLAQSGIASTFNDARTACHPYHPVRGRLEIAHRTLPCGTKVMITNKLNGRSVVAYVGDIGPCSSVYCRTRMPVRVRLRVIDLRPEVAIALGRGRDSLTPVIVTALR